MATEYDALSSWDRLLSLFQIFSRVRFGLLGDGRGNVTIPGKYGWSWIRFDGDQSKLSQVRNYVTNVVDSLPVVVGKRHPSDDFEQVLYIALDLYSQKLTEKILIDYLNPPHGESHHGTYGSDPAPIDLNNLMPGRLQRTDPASMSVYVHPFYYPYGMSLETFAGIAIDLTAYVPGGGGTHLYALVYVELDSGDLNAIAGDAVPLAATPSIPDAPEWCIPIGVVTLENGMTEITGSYWQYKALWCSIGQLASIHTHSSDTQGGTSIVGLEELMFSCHEPLYMMGNAIYPTHTYHSLYIQGMYIEDMDVEADLVWIHADPVWGCGQILIIRPGINGLYTNYNINVRHGVGNIQLSCEQDIVLDSPQDHLMLIYDGEYWCDFIDCTNAPVDAQYVTLALDANLTNERVLTAGVGIILTDAGAGNTITVAVDETLYLRLDCSNDPLTAGLEINAATLNEPVLIVQTTDNNAANDMQEWQNAAGAKRAFVASDGRISSSSIGLALSATARISGVQYGDVAGEVVIINRTLTGITAAGAYRGLNMLVNAGNLAGVAAEVTGNRFQVNTGTTRITNLTGFTARLTHTGTGTIDNEYGVDVTTSFNAGTTITNMYGYRAVLNVNHAGATIDNVYAFYGRILNIGTMTNAWGLYLEDVNIAVNNWAIYTKLGLVHFGDQVEIIGSAAADVQFTVRGAAAQTANLLELQESDGSIMLASGDGLGGSVFSGNVQLEDIDFVWAGDTEPNLFRIDAGLDAVHIGDWDTNYFSVDKFGDTKWVGGGGLVFGSCYGNHIGWSQAAAVQNTWYNISIAAMASGPLHNVTHDGDGLLTVTEPGMYLVVYSLCYSDSIANNHIEVGIEINSSGAAEAAGQTHSENKFANQEEHLGGGTILDLADNSTIEIAIRTTDAAPLPNIAVQGLNISVVMVGGT